MEYTLIQKPNPRDLEAPKKWYAIPVNKGCVSIEEMSEIIAKRSSLTPGDVYSAVYQFFDLISDFVDRDQSVSLGEIGRMRGSFSSEGVENPDDFDVKMIKDKRIIYTPSVKIKKRLKAMKVSKSSKCKIKKTKPKKKVKK